MNSRNLLNIFLLILVMTLTSFFFWKNNDTSYLKLKLTNLDKYEITTITIPREKGDIVLQLTASGWHMQKPYKIRAHNFRINQLLNLTQLIAETSYDVENMDLAKFNLSPSDTTIIFNKTMLEFGNTNPVNMMRYIKSDHKLFLVKDTIYPLLRSQPSSFVSLSLLPDDSIIKSISLPKYTIIKDPAKHWKTTPEQTFDADRIEELIQRWQKAQAFGVHAYLERKNLGQIKFDTQDGLIVFEITDNEPWLILARKDLGIEYHLDKSQAEALLEITAAEPETPPDN